MAEQKKERKSYSNSYHSLEAIWTVLRLHASREHPLNVGEICQHLQRMEQPPSRATVNRLLTQMPGALELFSPDVLVQQDAAACTGAYQAGDALHVVLETPDGTVLHPDASLDFTVQPFQAPAYSSVDNLLKDGVPFDLKTFPFQLRCVARKKSATGRYRYIPYDQWEEKQQARRNNAARYYYLANPLTDGEWRIFTDLVQVYPYISPEQTKKFLGVLSRLQARPAAQPPSRYAWKRGNPGQFERINQLDQAIREHRMVRITYGEYRLALSGQRWQPQLVQRKKNGLLTVTPYALMWSNGYYYLVCRHRGMMNLRTDRILQVEILPDTFTPPQNFDPAQYRDRCPVMYPGRETFVRMRCHERLLNTLVDFFGSAPQYTQPDQQGVTEVTMSIAAMGVKLFALQYADDVEVLEPQWLRDKISETLARGAEKYGRS